jgi:hypothetical protein
MEMVPRPAFPITGAVGRVSGHDMTPRSTSCRLVYITAYFTALVLLAAYSAALISSLTVYRSNLPFQDLEGILMDRTYKLGVLDKSEMFYSVSVRYALVCAVVLKQGQFYRVQRDGVTGWRRGT